MMQPQLVTFGQPVADLIAKPNKDQSGDKVTVDELQLLLGGSGPNFSSGATALDCCEVIPLIPASSDPIGQGIKAEILSRHPHCRAFNYDGMCRISWITPSKTQTYRPPLSLATIPSDLIDLIRNADMSLTGPMAPEDRGLVSQALE
ncbi:MAG: hypothetical protein IH994_09380, partial [Proteobacteria bacterium]|nr:hypothetical protein [Pseudomonadota bacterium]